MSWSTSTVLKNEAPQKNLDVLSAIDRTNIGNQHCTKERDEQIDAVIRAVFQLLMEAGFGNAEEISVSMSGHANKDHNKDDSWSNEFVNINVAVKSYR
jgi:hypothetical protein